MGTVFNTSANSTQDVARYLQAHRSTTQAQVEAKMESHDSLYRYSAPHDRNAPSAH